MTDNPLRIAMLSAHSCPVGTLGAKDTGGMSVYIRELTREMGQKGHSVDVYTRVHDPKDPQIVNLGANARLIHLKAGGDEEIHKLAVYSYLPDFACNLENFRKLNSLQYDLVFSHYWLSTWAGKHLQQWWRVPHLAMFHTLGAVKNAIGVGEDEPELRLEMEREAVQDCQHIIASTVREKEELILRYGAPAEKISIVPCGVNMELFQPIDKDLAKQRLRLADDKIILCIGRIEPLKGIEQLLKAMPYLTNSQKARLIIIGGDENSQYEIERLMGLSRSLQVRCSVTFLGSIKQERMPLFYSAADVCVIPSYYESFGMVGLESLACGTPVVANDVGDFKNIIHQGETGYVVTDNSPHHLADKIALLLARQRPDAKTILSMRASVSRFSWRNIAEAIIKESRLVLSDYLAAVS